MPFASKRQQRAAFAGKIPGIDPHEWAAETDFKKLPERAPAEKGKPTMRSKKAVLSMVPLEDEVAEVFKFAAPALGDSLRTALKVTRPSSAPPQLGDSLRQVLRQRGKVASSEALAMLGYFIARAKLAARDEDDEEITGNGGATLGGFVAPGIGSSIGAGLTGPRHNWGRRAISSGLGSVGGAFGGGMLGFGAARALGGGGAAQLAAGHAGVRAGGMLGGYYGNKTMNDATKHEAAKEAALGTSVASARNVGRLKGMMTQHALKTPGVASSMEAMNPRRNVINAMNSMKPK